MTERRRPSIPALVGGTRTLLWHPLHTPHSPTANMASVSQYRLTERGSSRVLQIGDWLISTVKKPILNGREIEACV